MTLLQMLQWLGTLPAEAWLIPPVLILTAMTAVWWIRRSLLLRRYRAIAARTGLAVRPKILNASEVRGTFRGHDLVMQVVWRRRQTIRRRWTRVDVGLRNPEVIGLQMWRESSLDRLVVAAGASEIRVGDPEFDRRFVIRSRDEAQVAKMFQDRVLRDRMLRADIDSVHLRSSDMWVYYARIEKDREHAHLLFTAATALADAIDAIRPDYTPEIS